jgi:hypothetical protein
MTNNNKGNDDDNDSKQNDNSRNNSYNTVSRREPALAAHGRRKPQQRRRCTRTDSHTAVARCHTHARRHARTRYLVLAIQRLERDFLRRAELRLGGEVADLPRDDAEARGQPRLREVCQ